VSAGREIKAAGGSIRAPREGQKIKSNARRDLKKSGQGDLDFWNTSKNLS
jgi:hypothetical protein